MFLFGHYCKIGFHLSSVLTKKRTELLGDEGSQINVSLFFGKLKWFGQMTFVSCMKDAFSVIIQMANEGLHQLLLSSKLLSSRPRVAVTSPKYELAVPQ